MERRTVLQGAAMGIAALSVARLPFLSRDAAPPESQRKLEKPLLLLGQGWENLTLTHGVLALYLERKYGVISLDDYWNVPLRKFSVEHADERGRYLRTETRFYDAQETVPPNAFQFDYVDTGSGIARRRVSADLYPGRTIESVREDRVRLLAKYPRAPLFMKVRAPMLTPAAFAHLKENFRVICLESANPLREAILEHAAALSGRYTVALPARDRDDALDWDLRPDYEAIRENLARRAAYPRFAAELRDKIVLHSEEISALKSPLEILALAGFPDYRKYVRPEDLRTIHADARPSARLIERWSADARVRIS